MQSQTPPLLKRMRESGRGYEIVQSALNEIDGDKKLKSRGYVVDLSQDDASEKRSANNKETPKIDLKRTGQGRFALKRDRFKIDDDDSILSDDGNENNDGCTTLAEVNVYIENSASNIPRLDQFYVDFFSGFLSTRGLERQCAEELYSMLKK